MRHATKMKRILYFSLLFCLFYPGLSNSQVFSPKFKHLSTIEGLSQSHVSTILKDSRGFMWFGTEDGLDKYDGYKFTHYKNDRNNKSSIIDNLVYDILEYPAGNLWVTTAGGLDRLDLDKNIFTHYSNGWMDGVSAIFLDNRKRIWLGTGKGLYQLNIKNGSFTKYSRFDNKTGAALNDFIYKIAEDTKGNLWVATTAGLLRFDPKTGKFVQYIHDPKNNHSIGADLVKTVFVDHQGDIWVGTRGGGVALYDKKVTHLQISTMIQTTQTAFAITIYFR